MKIHSTCRHCAIHCNHFAKLNSVHSDFKHCSVGIDFSRQNLHIIGIQMNRKDLIRTLTEILN